MELTLYREYFPEGTNGSLFHLGKIVCYTIELPWRNNEQSVSCIPEGRYRLARRNSERYGYHLVVREVPGRSGILLHPANDALAELRGCLAPVSRLTGAGRGIQSRMAMRKVASLVYDAPWRETVYLTIKTKSNEHHRKNQSTDTEVFP